MARASSNTPDPTPPVRAACTGKPTSMLGVLAHRFDPGWLFLVAGLMILTVGMLVPALRDTQELRLELVRTQRAQTRVQDRIRRSTSMLDDLMSHQQPLITRVVMSDRNLLLPGDEPVLRDLEAPGEVLQWLDASIVQSEVLESPSPISDLPVSTLESMATGPWRMWFLAAGAMCLCIGLTLGPSAVRQKLWWTSDARH